MTTAAVLAQMGSNNTTFRNRIINPGMVIDQRNAGASVTPTSGQYTVDRWNAVLTQTGKFSVQQNAGSVTPPAGFTNYLGVTSLSSYSVTSTDYFVLSQGIEGFNCADLGWGTANAQTVTLSFRVYSSLTGTFGGVVRNNAFNRTYPFTYSVASANTWTSVSITIPGDTSGTWLTSNSAGIYLHLGLGVGSTYSGTAGAWSGSTYWSATGATSVVGTNGATFYITGVQFEAGTNATPFEFRPYGTELALCQRYYEKSFGQSQSLTTFDGTGRMGAYAINTIDFYNLGWINFKVTKRASPTATTYSTNSRAAGKVYSGSVDVTATFTSVSDSGGFINSGTNALTAGAVYVWQWTAESEL